MVDLFEEYERSKSIRSNGTEVDVGVRNGKSFMEIPDVEGQIFYPEGDAPRPELEGDFMDRTVDTVVDVGQAATGLAGGGFSGVAGFPGDLAGLIAGVGSALFPNDKGRLEAFTDTFMSISEAVGSEAILNIIRETVNASNMTQEDKQQILNATEVGSVVGLPGLIPAGKTVARGAKAYAAGAEARVAERQGSTTLTSGVDPTEMIDDAIINFGKSVKPSTEELKTVLDARAAQMELPMAQRVQPRQDDDFFDLDYLKITAEQKEVPVPRVPEGKTLPKFNRAAKVIEMSEQIAEVLAERAKPFVGTNVQYFYHTGPIIDKAMSLGIPEETARKQLRKFAENYAATSPRTQTEANVRSATLVTAKQKAGLQLSDIVGVGSGGLNEKGYPMMIGPGGIHQQLVDDAASGGFNFNTNPKPATFVENVSGNFSGVTADTHAIRAVFDAMNEIDPGSVPIDFIGGRNASQTKELRAQYEANPSSLDVSNMISDRLASQKINGKSVQTEYAVFSDIYKNVAKKLGVEPAEAQSLSWFANGDKTGLGSAPKTIVELINERIDVTAQVLGQTKDEIFKKFLQGSIPLLSLGGLTLLDTGASQTNTEAADGS